MPVSIPSTPKGFRRCCATKESSTLSNSARLPQKAKHLENVPVQILPTRQYFGLYAVAAPPPSSRGRLLLPATCRAQRAAYGVPVVDAFVAEAGRLHHALASRLVVFDVVRAHRAFRQLMAAQRHQSSIACLQSKLPGRADAKGRAALD